MNIENINFDATTGLIPAIVQDQKTQTVLMFAFMNKESLALTLETQKLTFYSRSRKKLWTKGETSGHFLNLVSWSVDCDQDCLLFKVHAQGPACHLGTTSCFVSTSVAESDATSQTITGSALGGANNTMNTSFPKVLPELSFLTELEATIADRISESGNKASYVSQLVNAGIDKVAQKVGEEAVETVIASKNNDPQEFKNEAADLLFHYLILLKAKNTSLGEIVQTLKGRKK